MNIYFEEKCGIFAIHNFNEIGYVENGLKELQHRGRDSYGVVYHNGYYEKQMGKVRIGKGGRIGIGHVRYSTIKKSENEEDEYNYTQPIKGRCFYLAHNGNLPNHVGFDSGFLVSFINKLLENGYNFENALIKLLNDIEGVYSLLILHETGDIYAIKDRYGVRPLVLGRCNKGYAISSESCALGEYELVRDIYAGEIMKIDGMDGNISMVYKYDISGEQQMFCSFEYIYFMRHTSINQGKKVEKLRYRLGFELGIGEDNICEDAVVLCLPNTAIPSAQGFADAVKLSFKNYISKTENAERSFILPTNLKRSHEISKKFAYNVEKLVGKVIYIVDDSIVRGNTFKGVLKVLREIAVKEIHIRVASPPVRDKCYYGIDIPTSEELIASGDKTEEDLREIFVVDSIKYLDIESMVKILDQPVCTSCFTGKYKFLEW